MDKITIYEELDTMLIHENEDGYELTPATKPVLSEISLHIYVNASEVATLLCLDLQHIELAVGFLFSEGIINCRDDILDVNYVPADMAVNITLRNGLAVRQQNGLRSLTVGCGKCLTNINPMDPNQYKPVESVSRFALPDIMEGMKSFITESELYRVFGGVHSLLFRASNYNIISEDLGRHNCFDKIIGILLLEQCLDLAKYGMVFISGRVTSEIMTKAIRLGVPLVVSKSTPSAAAIKLAQKQGVTLLGYVKGNSGFVYTGVERLSTN